MAYCNFCGAEIANNASICPNCGSVISSQSNTQTQNTTQYAPAYPVKKKKICRTIAFVLALATAILALIGILPCAFIGFVGFTMFDEMVLEMANTLPPDFITMYAEIGMTIEDITAMGIGVYVVMAVLLAAIAVVNAATAVISLAIKSKKVMIPFAIVSLVLNVLLSGGPTGIACGILLLCAPRGEFNS